MPLQKQPITVTFTDGVDTKTDQYLSTKLDILENGFIGQQGTINKRNGFDELSTAIDSSNAYTGTNLSAGEILVTSNNALAQISGNGAYLYNPSRTNPWRADYTDSPPRFYQLSSRPVSFSLAGGQCLSVMSEDNIDEILYVANYYSGDIGGVKTTTSAIFRENKETGNIQQTVPQVDRSSAYSTGQLVQVDGEYLYSSKTGTSIAVANVTTYTYSPSFTTIITDANPGLVGYNIFSANALLVVCYVNSTGKPCVKFFKKNLVIQGTLVATETLTVDTGFAFCWDPVNSKYAFFYSTSSATSVKAVCIDIAYSQVGTTQTISISGGYINSLLSASKAAIYDTNNSIVALMFESAASASTPNIYSATFDTSTQTFTITGLAITRSRLASQLILMDGNYVFVIAKGTNTVSGSSNLYNNYLVDTGFNLITKLTNEYLGSTSLDGILGSFNSRYTLPISNQGPQVVELSNSNFNGSNPKEIISTGFFGLGQAFEFDGVNLYDSAFTSAPYLTELTQSAGIVPIGTYSYVAVAEYYDAAGNRHLSNPSSPIEVTISGSPKRVVFNVLAPDLSRKPVNAISVRIYRKLSTDSNYNFVTTGNYDNLSTVATNELLYTTGGVLDNDSPVVSNVFATHGDRMFLINEERPNLVYFSKKVSLGDKNSNVRGLEFSNFLYFAVNDNSTGYSERCTALASLDDKLVVFKNHSIYVIFGDGPNALGQGSFNPPKLLSSDVGCSTPRSIVLSTEGLYFKSAKGIYLISRSLELSYVGADVEEFNSLEITSAVLMADINQVRFTTRTGMALVYNYYYKGWSTFTNYESAHAVTWLGKYTHLLASGATRTENMSSFLDVAATIRLRVVLGWLKISGIQNMQRIYRLMFLGVYKSAHNITVNLSYDYENYAWDSYNITILSSDYNRSTKPTQSELYAGANDGIYQYEIHTTRQKCQSIKFEMFDTSIVGESYSLTGLSVIAGVKNGIDKLSSNKKF